MADFNDFKAKYPELVSAADANQPAIDLCLAEAAIVVDLSRCPKFSDYMQLSYAAHCIAKSGNNPNGIDESSGPISSKSVGSISVSYQISESKSASDDFYRSTNYGIDFLRFRRLCFGGSATIVP